jgi:hypothetical protein
MRTDHSRTSTRLSRIATVVACIATVSACARAHRATDAPSPDSHRDLAGTEAEPDGVAVHRPQPSLAGTVSTEAGSGAASFVAERAAPDCRGPGFFGHSEGSSWMPCCAGLHLYAIPVPGMDEAMQKVCIPSPGGDARACVKGTCGDGVCEDGESAVCGCVVDCPVAAWEGTTTEAFPNDANGFSEPPASCDKGDVLTRLQGSPGSIDCGELVYEASSAQVSAAIHCVRDAHSASKPFHVFWQVLVNDRPSWRGLVARLEAGQLRTFHLEFYDVDAGDLGLDGASATWRRVSLRIDPQYSHSFEACITSTWLDRIHCDCLPQGKRPDAPAGEKVELRCNSQ